MNRNPEPKPEAAITILPEHAVRRLLCHRCSASVELLVTGDVAWSDVGPARDWSYTQETGRTCPRH